MTKISAMALCFALLCFPQGVCAQGEAGIAGRKVTTCAELFGTRRNIYSPGVEFDFDLKCNFKLRTSLISGEGRDTARIHESGTLILPIGHMHVMLNENDRFMFRWDGNFLRGVFIYGFIKPTVVLEPVP